MPAFSTAFLVGTPNSKDLRWGEETRKFYFLRSWRFVLFLLVREELLVTGSILAFSRLVPYLGLAGSTAYPGLKQSLLGRGDTEVVLVAVATNTAMLSVLPCGCSVPGTRYCRSISGTSHQVFNTLLKLAASRGDYLLVRVDSPAVLVLEI